MARSSRAASGQQTGDVLVVFGITGDLARVMTFRSLYRLEQRGLLDCPIVGVAVDEWSLEQLVERARASIVGTGEQLDAEVFDRLAARLSYVQGDFADDATYKKVGAAIKGASCPVFYLEIPPFLFATVVKGLADAGLTKSGRVVVEKPFGHDLCVGARARRRAARVPGRVAALPDRPLPREDGPRRDPLPAIREHDARADLEPQLTSSVSRSRWPRTSASKTAAISTIRSVRCATSSSTISCRCSRPPRWRRRRAATRRR